MKADFKKWMRLTNKKNGGAFEESSIENYLSYINTMPDFIESVTGKKVGNIFSVKNVGDAEHFFKNEFEPIEGLLKTQNIVILISWHSLNYGWGRVNIEAG